MASDRHRASVHISSILRIATWNVRTLHQLRKLANIDREMRRLGIDIMGISEVRWTGAGSVSLADGGCLVYSGGDTHVHGVGFC